MIFVFDVDLKTPPSPRLTKATQSREIIEGFIQMILAFSSFRVFLFSFQLFIFRKSQMIGFMVFQVHSQLSQGVQPYIVLEESSGRCPVSLSDEIRWEYVSVGINVLVPYRVYFDRFPEQVNTPWKINMEPTNHLFRKEIDLPNLLDYDPC